MSLQQRSECADACAADAHVHVHSHLHPASQPEIKVVMMEDVDTGISAIARELGLGPVTDVKRNTADWPFAD